MTNAPEGRTYTLKKWVLDPDIESGKRPSRHYHRYYDADEYVIDETPYVVPNGMWVMDRHGGEQKHAQIVGASHHDIESVLLENLYGTPTYLEICHKPFGYILADWKDVDWSVHPSVVRPNGRKTLVCARQVWKGELSHGGTQYPHYVREPIKPGKKPNVHKEHERRHGPYGWVKLSELAEAAVVGYGPDKQLGLVLGYWQFSQQWLIQPDGSRVTAVKLAWGSRLDIEAGDSKSETMTAEDFREESDPSELWLPRGFAYTILRLQALGVEPSILQTA